MAEAGAAPKRDGADALCSGMEWLEDEAAHLERSLLRDCRRLAQVRLERQRSSCLDTDLEANIARVGSQQAKVAAELARRAGANARSAQKPVEPAAVRPPASGEVGAVTILAEQGEGLFVLRPPAVGRVAGLRHACPDPGIRARIMRTAALHALARASAAQQTHTAGSEPAVPSGQPCGNHATHWAARWRELKTQADRCGLQLRCEDERVSEQEWRARIVLTTSAGPVTALPWSGVCLGLKRAKQAAAELALDCMQQGTASGPKGKAAQAKPAAAAEEAGTGQAASRTLSRLVGKLSKKQRQKLRRKEQRDQGRRDAVELLNNYKTIANKGERGTLGDLVVAAASAAPQQAGGVMHPSIALAPPSAPPSKPAAAASGQQQRAPVNNGASVAAQATPQPPAQASTAPATRQASGAPPAAGNSNVQHCTTPDTSRVTPAPAAVSAHKAASESGQQLRAQSKPGASATLPVATEHATALTQALPPQGEEALPKAFKSVSVERCKEDAALCTRDKAAVNAAVVASDGGGLRPGSIPTVGSLMLFKHEPAQAIEPKDWRQEEHVFGVFARVAARRPLVNKIDTVHSEALRSFCAHTASIVLCECAEASACGLGPLRECRQDLVAACRTAGLELDELSLGLAYASQEGKGRASGLSLANGSFEIPPGYLELVEAAVAAGAVRVVRSGGEWHVQRGERVGADEDWSPPAVDVSIKFGVSNQCLPGDDAERVDETRLMFQVKSVPRDFVFEEFSFIRTSFTFWFG
jgi:hypothetical protein